MFYPPWFKRSLPRRRAFGSSRNLSSPANGGKIASRAKRASAREASSNVALLVLTHAKFIQLHRKKKEKCIAFIADFFISPESSSSHHL